MAIVYTGTAVSVGGRKGQVRTDDGNLHFTLALQKGLTGEDAGQKTNPEQLFACGYAACFGSAVDMVAQKHGAQPSEVRVTCAASLDKSDDGFAISAKLTVGLPGVDRATAEKIVHEAHTVCPYSKATRGNIPVELAVE